MSLLADLRVRVGADISELQTKMAIVRGEVGGMGGLDKIASAGIIGVAAVVAGLGVVSLKMAGDFQQSTAQVAVNAQIPMKAAEDIGRAFLSTAGDSVFSAKAMMDAYAPVTGKLGELKGSALTTSEAFAIMNASTDLAEATGGDLAISTKALTDVMTAYHMPLTAAAGATDILFNSSRIANVGVDIISQAVDKMHARLGDATPSLASTSGLLVDLSDHGMTGSRGLLQVTTAMMTLEKGGKPVNDLLGSLGVSLKDAAGNTLPLTAVFAQLQPKLLEMSPAARDAAIQTLFHASSTSALGKVVMEGAPGLQAHIDTVSKVGSAHNGAMTATDTLAASERKLKATFDDAMVTIGNKMVPAVNDLAKKDMPLLISATGWLADHLNIVVPLLATTVGLFIAWKVALAAHAVVMGMVTVATGLWAAAQWVLDAAMDANPIGLIVIAIALLIGISLLVVTHWTQISNFFKGLWAPIAAVFTDAWNNITGFLSGVWTGISNTVSNIWNGITDFFKRWGPFILVVLTLGLALIVMVIIQHWQQISDFTSSIWNNITGFLGNIWNGISNTVSNVWNGIYNFTSSIWNNISGAISGPVNSVRNWLGGVWNGISTDLGNAFNGILGWIGGIVDNIVGAITGPFSRISIPLPHFNVSSAKTNFMGVQFDVPQVDVKWYAQGGIFDKPTMLAGGAGVGDAGPEAAAPISELAKYLPDNSPKMIAAIEALPAKLAALLAAQNDHSRSAVGGNLDKNSLLRALGSLMAEYEYANQRGLMRPA